MILFYRILCSFSFLFIAVTTFAQTGGVTGKATDASNKKPLEFATIILLNATDSSTIKTAQSDLNGNFRLQAVADGNYVLRISFVGYKNLEKNITVAANVVNAGSLALTGGKQNVLKEVKIVAQKPDIQLGIDKKVFSVEKSLVSEGGSATDLLANVPSIQVDANGGVSLRGSGNVRVLINGKTSALAGSSLADVLQSIPANSIQNIEVMTNPSSKYDPEGQSGIINIVLKKNVQQGINGSFALSAGTLDTYNATGSLAWQNEHVNLYGNYSFRTGRRQGDGFSNRSNFQTLPNGADTTFYFNQTDGQRGRNTGHNIRSGIDVNLSKLSTLSFSNNLNFRNRTRFETGNNIGLNEQLAQTRLTTQNNTSDGKGFNYDLNLDFDQKFKREKEQLTANMGFSKGDNNRDEMLTTGNYRYFTSSENFYQRVQLNTQDGLDRNWNLQIDYTRPLGKEGKLETGYRTTLERDDDNFLVDTLNAGSYMRDNNLSNRFIYDEKVHALYGNYQQQFGNFGVQAGVRAEDAIIDTRLATTDQRNRQRYFRLYPSVFLSQKLKEGQTLQVSYTRRVSRPGGRQLSPFLDRDDPLNLRIGNPALQPEDTHSFELSYARIWQGFTLTSSLYYRRTNNIIQSLRTTDASGVSLTQYANLSNGTNAGFEFIGRTSISKKIDLTGNVNLYQRNINGTSGLGVAASNGFAYNGNLTSNIILPKNFSAQLRVDYNGPEPIAQGKSRGFYGFDGAVKYDFADKKSSLSLNARDIFRTRRFGSTLSDATFFQVSERRFSTRVVNLTFAHRFGSVMASKKKERQNEQSDERQNDNSDEQN